MFTWVEHQPAVLRPAYYGAFFVWALILFRGGLIVLPIMLPVLFFTDRELLWRFLLVFCVLAPAGGFVGGLLYSLIGLTTKRLGVVGAILKFTGAATCYFIVLAFLIVPILDHKERPSFGDTDTWYVVGVLGLGMGLILALSTRKGAA